MERKPTYKIGRHTFTILFENLIRPLTPIERKTLKESIKEHGILDPITIDAEFGVIDGANRVELANELGLLDIPWVTSKAKNATAKEKECKEINLSRRHMTVEELAAARAERIERVVEAREDGQSMRTIAEKEGVSLGQIQRDLDAAGVSGDTPETPEKTVGKDGKKYKSKTTQVSNGKPEPATKTESKTDDIDAEIPASVAEVFETAAEFKSVLNAMDRIKADVRKLKERPGGERFRLQPFEIDFDKARRTLRFDIPYAVCPICKGDKPKDCRCKGLGWFSESTYKQLPTEYRA